MFIKKTAEQILQEAMQSLAKQTSITNFSPGSIARAMLEAVNQEFESLYSYGEHILNMGFISKAEGIYLDLIGDLFSYPRRNESVYIEATNTSKIQPISDDSYRYELSNRVLTAASANRQAVRLGCLSVLGVQNVILKEFAHGIGSFSVFVQVIPGYSFASIRQQVQEVIENVKGFGIYATVEMPVEIPIEMDIELYFSSQVNDLEKQSLRLAVKSTLLKYFGSFQTGDDWIYNDVAQQIMNVSEEIVDFSITRLWINQQESLLVNYLVGADELIVAQYINTI